MKISYINKNIHINITRLIFPLMLACSMAPFNANAAVTASESYEYNILDQLTKRLLIWAAASLLFNTFYLKKLLRNQPPCPLV